MNPSPPKTEELTGDPYYPPLKEYVIQTTGMSYYSQRDDDLARRIQHRLTDLGLQDCASYLQVLRDGQKGRLELDELIAEITIGETYFFRHPEHFDALRDIVLPDLIERNQGQRSLRIWCAGCADGPEAYSLAILLGRDLGQRMAGWEVSILGTDINRRSLARAREGKFEKWALRATDEGLKRECFTGEGSGWRIDPKFKRGVSFRYYNLVEDPIPSLVNNIAALDLIVCRNVTIYFEPDITRRIVEQFHESLVEGGWLLVGPTEPNMTFFKSFCAVNAPGVTLYHKRPQRPRQAYEPVAPPAEARLKPIGKPVSAVQKSVAAPAIPAERTLADVRKFADRGEWANAVECCEQLLKKNSLNSQVHFFHGLVLEQMGRHAEAEPALRKAIYLDRQTALPHYYLGLMLQSRGDAQRAARCFENTLDLLESCAGTDVLADADGITVAEMKKLAKMHLEVLDIR